jgi:hypothetical protein
VAGAPETFESSPQPPARAHHRNSPIGDRVDPMQIGGLESRHFVVSEAPMRSLFRKFNRGTLWLALPLLVGFKLSGIAYNQAATPEDERGSIPNYKVDPSWPKQLPHDWIIGQVGGLTFGPGAALAQALTGPPRSTASTSTRRITSGSEETARTTTKPSSSGRTENSSCRSAMPVGRRAA